MVRLQMISWGLLVAICLVLLTGCINTSTTSFEPTSARPKSSNQTQIQCGAACLVQYEIFIWEDIDQDGQCDEPEPPLPGIPVILDHAHSIFILRAQDPLVTDQTGTATLQIYVACPCGEQAGSTIAQRMVEISPEFTINPPTGCIVTTPDRLTMSPYLFGLRCQAGE
jgi:hypothetical protein